VPASIEYLTSFLVAANSGQLNLLLLLLLAWVSKKPVQSPYSTLWLAGC